MSRLFVTLATAAVVTLSLVTTPAAQAADAQGPSGMGYTPVNPTRIFDSRNLDHKIYAHSQIQVPVPTDVVPADATTVVFNLTGTDTDGATWVAAGDTANTSNLNLGAGETRANLVTASVSKGLLDLRIGPNGLNLIVDVEGYYSPTGSGYTPVPGQRVLDTRTTGGVGPQGTVTVDLSSSVPAGATAAVFNLTGTDVTQDTFVTAYPAGQAKPDASTLNLAAAKNTPNLVTVKLSADGKVNLTNAFGHVDLIADLAGYYSPDSVSRFYPLAPFRALDTRDADGNPREPITANAVHEMSVRGWLPDQSTSVVLNLTGTNVTASTFLRLWPSLTQEPDTSVLNLDAGQISSNAAIVGLSPSHGLEIRNLAGQVDAIVDIAGYFAPSFPTCTAKCVVTSGYNDTGALGDGTTNRADVSKSTTVYGLSDVTQVTSYNGVTYALTSNGRVWSWGDNATGQLGNGLAGQADAPAVQGPENRPQGYYNPVPERTQLLSSVRIVAISHGYALDDFGNVYAWGSNEHGRLGTGEPDSAVAQAPEHVNGLSQVIAIVGDDHNGYALTSAHTVWAWGDNTQGLLGIGTSTGESSVPVKVSTLSDVTAIADRLAVKSDGSVWQWGPNGDFPAEVDTPVPVQGLTGITAVASTLGYPNHANYALKSDGTVWAWGYQADNALGDGSDCGQTSCHRATPAQIPGLDSVRQISGGALSGFALRIDGTVYAWGHSEGEFGDGNRFENWPTPQRMDGLSGIVSIGDSGVSVRG